MFIVILNLNNSKYIKMPQLIPFYFVNQITFVILTLFIITYVLSIYILPLFVNLFVTRVYVTKL